MLIKEKLKAFPLKSRNQTRIYRLSIPLHDNIICLGLKAHSVGALGRFLSEWGAVRETKGPL